MTAKNETTSVRKEIDEKKSTLAKKLRSGKRKHERRERTFESLKTQREHKLVLQDANQDTAAV